MVKYIKTIRVTLISMPSIHGGVSAKLVLGGSTTWIYKELSNNFYVPFARTQYLAFFLFYT